MAGDAVKALAGTAWNMQPVATYEARPTDGDAAYYSVFERPGGGKLITIVAAGAQGDVSVVGVAVVRAGFDAAAAIPANASKMVTPAPSHVRDAAATAARDYAADQAPTAVGDLFVVAGGGAGKTKLSGILRSKGYPTFDPDEAAPHSGTTMAGRLQLLRDEGRWREHNAIWHPLLAAKASTVPKPAILFAHSTTDAIAMAKARGTAGRWLMLVAPWAQVLKTIDARGYNDARRAQAIAVARANWLYNVSAAKTGKIPYMSVAPTDDFTEIADEIAIRFRTNERSST